MSDRADGLTHLDGDGRARMVNVTAKDVTDRIATAEGRIVMQPSTLEKVMGGRTAKGDPIQIAELAGIMAGKKTADLIPLCHSLPGASITVRLEADPSLPGIVAQAEARIAGQTGVEMEALTAVTVALLTVYDMVKAVDRGMSIEGVRLLRKDGGASGGWVAEP
ncbi:MAG: cyclic pyranopterin monophosphate synthase MoaC [Gemmatimonadetes bacterium]|nr:cyclic pyranopterin monophosphate synthase MoaC [Gemmatimonadota bacterium]MDA1104693.1 cyclic pyranopterin monophosphate synthase MoaC [Gemmatimonadota bacterium]